eukprot:CAMPEP_0194138466 /NCGR_PEP_ID=MMETSP0152-20130528/8245_1 /TAXON_ID=1049557 /ORGANISM="Thalassiothrix antarctica, Strain L6-D1" /LENGTH=459 /DNA_ID=CAMNT_0038835921 /DNA_START=54 /DNA_END=1433 /DNA_ORIENTATION=+
MTTLFNEKLTRKRFLNYRNTNDVSVQLDQEETLARIEMLCAIKNFDFDSGQLKLIVEYLMNVGFLQIDQKKLLEFSEEKEEKENNTVEVTEQLLNRIFPQLKAIVNSDKSDDNMNNDKKILRALQNLFSESNLKNNTEQVIEYDGVEKDNLSYIDSSVKNSLERNRSKEEKDESFVNQNDTIASSQDINSLDSQFISSEKVENVETDAQHLSRMPTAELIEPGLVLLRQFINDSDCRALANMALKQGEDGDDGFYCKDKDGKMILNTGEKGRGRIYDAVTNYPKEVIDHCRRAVSKARSLDTEIPEMNCTHLLINMYTHSDGLVWHRDIYENDGRSDHPVVNLCVGSSCLFGFNHNENDPERVVKLNSGDVLLFGGPCRLIRHSVLEVLLEECPAWMKESPVRFSFTFRDSPEVLGREAEFKYFRVKQHLVGQEDFAVPTDPKTFRGLPSVATQSNSRK